MIARVLIADDEPLARDRIARLVRRVEPRAEQVEARDGRSAIAMIRDTRPDAVFLDVEMPGLDGFAVLAGIGAATMPPVVFVTAHEQHALAAFDAAAVDYLLKPYDEARFRRAWQRLLGHVDGRRASAGAASPAGAACPVGAAPAPERLVLRDGGRTILVPLEEVRWIESAGNYVVLHAADRQYRSRETLAGMAERLDPRRFVRIHRRYLVDIAAVREVRPWSGGDELVILRDGTRLQASRNFRAGLDARLGCGS